MVTYKAGIIGTGGIAGMGILGMHDQEKIGKEKFRASHAGGYHEADGIELVAIADVDKEKLDRFGKAWDIPRERRYIGHEAMLSGEDLDAVSVCTPSYLHHKPVLDAAQSAASPDVIWCEKPIAASVAETEEMIDVCDEEDAELIVNHSFRFTDKIQTLRDLIQKEGILGNVRSVSAQFRRELMRNSTHILDMFVYLLDARAEQVSGYINGENDAVEALDGASVDDSGGGGHIVMDDGTFTTVDCTVARDISSMALTFIGTGGKLYLNNDDGEWRYWRFEEGEHIEEELPGIEGAWSWEEDYRNAFPNAARHIVDLLEGEAEQNYSPGDEAAWSLEIIIAFYISHYTGAHVNVPLDRPLRDVTISSW